MIPLLLTLLLLVAAALWFFVPVWTASRAGGRAHESMQEEIQERIVGFGAAAASIIGFGIGFLLAGLLGMLAGLVLPVAFLGAVNAQVLRKKDWKD